MSDEQLIASVAARIEHNTGCPYYHAEQAASIAVKLLLPAHEELKERNATLKRELEAARAFIEQRGHDKNCEALKCAQDLCRVPSSYRIHCNRDHPYYHEFQSGKCSCGYNEVMGVK